MSRLLRIDAVAGTLDILFDQISGQLTFEALRSRGVHLSLPGCKALAASLADVIASKAAAGRPKDLAQLPILRDTLRVKQAIEKI